MPWTRKSLQILPVSSCHGIIIAFRGNLVPQRQLTTLPWRIFKFGNGQSEQVYYAAAVLADVAGRRGMVMTFLVDADVPVLFGGGALESMGGRLDFPRTCLRLTKLVTAAPLHANAAWRCVSNAASCDVGLNLRNTLPSGASACLSSATPPLERLSRSFLGNPSGESFADRTCPAADGLN